MKFATAITTFAATALITTLISTFAPAVSHAVESAPRAGKVYCESNHGLYDAESEDGHYECAEPLAMGTACFSGPRASVIDLINADAFNWDEEWLEDAHFKGRDSIAYTFADGPNELREKVSMERCKPAFLKR